MCCSALWRRYLFKNLPSRTELKSESKNCGRKPHLERERERDALKREIRPELSVRGERGARSSDLHGVSGTLRCWHTVGGVAFCHFTCNTLDIGCCFNPCVCSVFEVFMVSLAFAEWQEDVSVSIFLFFFRDLSLFHLSLIRNTPRRLIHRYFFWGLIMHPNPSWHCVMANSFRELSTIVLSFFFVFILF